MILEIQNDMLLEIRPEALKTLNHYRQIGYPFERGGILVGCISKDEKRYVITRVSTPTIFDTLRETEFIRSKYSAQRFINKVDMESNGYETYLGEWHSHPSSIARSSHVDRNLIYSCVKKNDILSKKLFMIILSNNRSDDIELNIKDYIGYIRVGERGLKEIKIV